MARNPQGYTEYDVRLISGYYWNIAPAVGIDPLIAWAQMLHETGNLTSWWCQRPRRNPAGIGVTGETSRARLAPAADWVKDERSGLWKRGYAFAEWSLSVRAHLGHLIGYALKDEQMTPTQRGITKYDPRFGALPASYRGVAPTLSGLNGRWAVPGTTYGASIAKIAEAIRVQ
jgi:hypothetical protein